MEILDKCTDVQFWEFMKLIEIEGWDKYHPEVYKIQRSIPWSHSLVAVDTNGKVIGGVQWSDVPDINLFYISTYIVDKSHQGRGVGGKLWERMLQYRKTGQILAIDSAGMTAKYRSQGGIPIAGEISMVRVLGTAGNLRNASLLECSSTQVNVKAIQKEHLSKMVTAYDRSIAGRDRTEFLNKYVTISGWSGVQARDPVTDGIVGYGMIVPAHHGWFKLGPVYADSVQIALKLISALLKAFPDDQQIICHVSSADNSWLARLCDDAGCKRILLSQRSYSERYEARMDPSKIFVFTVHLCQPDC